MITEQDVQDATQMITQAKSISLATGCDKEEAMKALLKVREIRADKEKQDLIMSGIVTRALDFIQSIIGNARSSDPMEEFNFDAGADAANA